ncbi:Uncharacterised protein [Vibrio cholerae]|nr:Uncharacterised protein [Vibrio cholerae]
MLKPTTAKRRCGYASIINTILVLSIKPCSNKLASSLRLMRKPKMRCA